ncbi:DUF2180 family protein [Streptomyces sp. NPDC048192]|uniref:DUF2180 family protein n=1 Tax=Streptomyces sp. NPDC048192 TaxID=3365510 RepID=UPI0037201BAC
MICYDCALERRDGTNVVGVCARCGLASCQDHAAVFHSDVFHASGMGRSVGPAKARRFVCNVCHTAEITR